MNGTASIASLGLSLASCVAQGAHPLALETIAKGLDSPLYLTAPPGDLERLFIVEQIGAIRVIERGVLLPEPFLALPPSAITCCLTAGLLSLAFHPEFAQNGRLFIDYVSAEGDV